MNPTLRYLLLAAVFLASQFNADAQQIPVPTKNLVLTELVEFRQPSL